MSREEPCCSTKEIADGIQLKADPGALAIGVVCVGVLFLRDECILRVERRRRLLAEARAKPQLNADRNKRGGLI